VTYSQAVCQLRLNECAILDLGSESFALNIYIRELFTIISERDGDARRTPKDSMFAQILAVDHKFSLKMHVGKYVRTQLYSVVNPDLVNC
jgi:hypothetical protein